jgi:flagellar motor switch protein FliM
VEVRAAAGSANLTVVYPLSWVEAVFGPPASRATVRPASEPPSEPERIRYEAALGTTAVELRAELGRARLTLTDLLALEPGDVIPLSGRPGEPIAVLLGEDIRYRALPGRAGARTALQITEALPALDTPPSSAPPYDA